MLWVYIIIAAAIVALVIYLVMGRKKQDQAMEGSSSESMDNMESQPEAPASEPEMPASQPEVPAEPAAEAPAAEMPEDPAVQMPEEEKKENM